MTTRERSYLIRVAPAIPRERRIQAQLIAKPDTKAQPPPIMYPTTSPMNSSNLVSSTTDIPASLG